MWEMRNESKEKINEIKKKTGYAKRKEKKIHVKNGDEKWLQFMCYNRYICPSANSIDDAECLLQIEMKLYEMEKVFRTTFISQQNILSLCFAHGDIKSRWWVQIANQYIAKCWIR